MFYQDLYQWQTLIGSFLGAAAPISLWFLTEWHQKSKNHKKHLYEVEKRLVFNIDNLIDTRNTINDFIEVRIPELINNINERNNNNLYSIDTISFPLIFTDPPSENTIMDINTKSGYIDNKVMHALRMSKSFSLTVEDTRQQFASMIKMNIDVALGKLNPPEAQRKMYIENINGFVKFAKQEMLERNIKNYMLALISARAPLHILNNWGQFRWRLKFEPHFRYFRNKESIGKFTDIIYDRIDKFIEPDVNLGIRNMENFYK